jgi:hypothetical protein
MPEYDRPADAVERSSLSDVVKRIMFSGDDPWGRHLDDATWFRPATRVGRHRRRLGIRGHDHLRGPLWRVFAARFAFIWPPIFLFFVGMAQAIMTGNNGWLALPLYWWSVLILVGAVVGVIYLRRWRSTKEPLHEVQIPTWMAVCDVLGTTFREREARNVVLPEDFGKANSEGKVLIKLPKGGFNSKLEGHFLDRVSATLNVPAAKGNFHMNSSKPFVEIERLKLPPKEVYFAHIKEFLEKCDWNEAVAGLDANLKPVRSDLKRFPHELYSAATGFGKSTLIGGLLCQFVRRGEPVLALDYRGDSHKWLFGVSGCVHAYKIEDIHRYSVAVGELMDRRRDARMESLKAGRGEIIFPRVHVVMEEANTTAQKLADYWAEIRPRGGPTKSPAVSALANLASTGRALGIHLHYVAQRADADAFGGGAKGGTMRTNFQERWLTGWTYDVWRMLVGGGVPYVTPLDDGIGVWIRVRPGNLTLFRGAMWTDEEMHEWAMGGEDIHDFQSDLDRIIQESEALAEPIGTGNARQEIEAPRVPPMTCTFKEAVNWLPGSTRDQLYKDSQRVEDFPKPVGKTGKENVFNFYELAAHWKRKTGFDPLYDPMVLGVLYAIWANDHHTGMEKLAYIGQTTQKPWTRRIDQHSMSKPWWDLMTRCEVIEDFDGKSVRQSVLDATEEQRIKADLPTYNRIHNEANPNAISIPEAERQRWDRDDRAGRDRWVKRDELNGQPIGSSNVQRDLALV